MNLFNKISSLFQPQRRFATLAILILLFAFAIRIWRVEVPTHFYFDEVYHAFTAQRFLHNDPKGYEYWNTPPAGVAYEWTHPPLAKLLMTLGMVIFGENSFGWRISSVLFGTGIILLSGKLASLCFHNKRITLFTLLFTSIDGLLLTMSRIAMNDVHVIFFILASAIFYVLLRRVELEKTISLSAILKPLILCAIFVGLALASKWTTLYLIAAFGIDQLVLFATHRKLPRISIVLIAPVVMVVIPIFIYLLSYTQFFLQGHQFSVFVELQKQMWWYHTGLKATHPYQSRPWQWILDVRPVWLFIDYSNYQKGLVANIYNVDNPVLLWAGLLSVLVTVTTFFVQLVKIPKTLEYGVHIGFFPKKWEVYFILLLYFMLWLPWVASPRIMFFYHYAPALPFLCILLSRGLNAIWERGRRSRIFVQVFIGLVVLIFAVIYPLNTGLFVPIRYSDAIFSIIPSWR